MLCFVIPLRSKSSSSNWERVSRIFEQTLWSAYQQTNPDFKIIVACDDIPQLSFSVDDRVEFLQMNSDSLVKDGDRRSEYKPGNHDKYRKQVAGFARAIELNADYIMFLDADDLVSRKLAEFVHSQPASNGWVIQRGYRYWGRSPFIRELHKFYVYCGSSFILSRAVAQMKPDDRGCGVKDSLMVRFSHFEVADVAKRLERPLAHLPFPGAIYYYGHGENHSEDANEASWLRRIIAFHGSAYHFHYTRQPNAWHKQASNRPPWSRGLRAQINYWKSEIRLKELHLFSKELKEEFSFLGRS